MLCKHTPLQHHYQWWAMALMGVLMLTYFRCAAQRPARSEEAVPSAAPARAVAEALDRIKRSSAGKPAHMFTPHLKPETPCLEISHHGLRDFSTAMLSLE